MERKNYLTEELSKEEKAYLKRIIMTARNKYIEKNSQYINTEWVELKEEILVSEDCLVSKVLEKYIDELKSAEKFIETMSNPLLRKHVKALSLREQEVLFYLFWDKKRVNDVAKTMKIHRTTVKRIRNRALYKIAIRMLEEGIGNV